MTSSRESVLRLPPWLLEALVALDVLLALVVFAPWQLVVLGVVLVVFAVGYRTGLG